MYYIICKNCGKDHYAGRANSKFCCDACRDKYNKKNRGHKQVCNYCGEEYRNYYKRKYCSFECSANQKKKERLIRELSHLLSLKSNCLYCGKEFIKTTHDKEYCTKNCSRLDYYFRNKKMLKRKCKECGKDFTTSDSRMQCCSKECSDKRNWRNAYLIRKRRAKSNGLYERDISVSGIIERDGSSCYLCGNKVDESSHYTSDYYPTIDHVVPLSKGGTHSWDNVRLAHRLCNMYKRDNKINDKTKQLALF